MSAIKKRSGVWPFSNWTNRIAPETEDQTDQGIRVRRKTRRAANRKLPKTDIIRAIVLCLWDNVSGPRTEQVWEGTGERISTETLNYICRYTLGGEINTSSSQDDSDSTLLQTKFHMLPQYDFLVSAVVFTGEFYSNGVNDSTTKWVLCALVDRCHLPRYMQLHKAYEENLMLLASMIQKQLETNPPAASVAQVNPKVELFVYRISFLTSCKTPEWEFKNTFFGDSPLHIHKEFLSRVITSHLQTHCSSVIVGSSEEDVDKINTLINTLMLFLTAEERELCSHVRQDDHFIPNLFLQGMIGDFDKTLTLRSIRPTSVIDISKMTIFQICAVRQHTKAREIFATFDIESVDKSNANKTVPDLIKEDNLFKPFKDGSSYVSDLVAEIFNIPQQIRKSHIQHFRGFLERKAVVLIRSVERFSDKKTNLDTLNSAILKRIKTDILRLNNEADFALILAIAEGISPGIGISIFGTIQEDLEKRFNDLWGMNI